MTLQSQQAYDRIRELIVDGTIATDEPLSERGLSDRLGLGRTPVREALKDLERASLISVIPGRGTVVKQLSFGEVQELYEVRLGIEGIACFLAAERGATPALLAFEPLLEAHLADEGADLAAIQEVGWRFHDSVVDATRNAQLAGLYGGLRDRIGLALRITSDNADTARIRATVGEHLEVLRAIKAGAADGAQKLMYRHLSNGLAARVRIFSGAVAEAGGSRARHAG